MTTHTAHKHEKKSDIKTPQTEDSRHAVCLEMDDAMKELTIAIGENPSQYVTNALKRVNEAVRTIESYLR